MRKTIPAIVLLFSALGQPASAQSPQTYTLTITAADVTVIGQALGVRPYNDVASIIAKMQAQINAQNEAAAKGANPPAPGPKEPQ